MHVDLALVGFGSVGRRFVRLLGERRDRLCRDHGLECRIIGIATRRHGWSVARDGINLSDVLARVEAGLALGLPNGPPALGASDVISALSRSAADLRVMIETTTLNIADGQPAIAHVEAALDAGCHVVTANKGPAAFAYRRLRDRAAANGLSFLFEGAVMDGIPVFNLVRETMPAIDIIGFRGVVNSTTNHILSAMEDGEEFQPALTRMQAEGIAEADPSLDVDGWDAAAKTAALANVLLDADLTPHGVDRVGIGPASASAARAAKAQGRRLRLVASAARIPGGTVRAAVRPIELPPDDILGRLRGMANALILSTDVLGDVAITQSSGGLTQTAYALLSDLIAIARMHHA
jgi:homoserine dehydrogenase